MNTNRLAILKAGLDAAEPENRALDRNLNLKLKDFLPPLDKEPGDRPVHAGPSDGLLRKLADFGVSLSDDDEVEETGGSSSRWAAANHTGRTGVCGVHDGGLLCSQSGAVWDPPQGPDTERC